jgi:hypothetical protein
MYATSVGLIMRGFEYLETYKKSFNAGNSAEFVRPKVTVAAEHSEQEEETFFPPVNEEEKVPLTEKIKSMIARMFEVEDQPIK